MKSSRFALYGIVLAPLSLSAALAQVEPPADGMLVAHTLSLKTPEGMPKLNPDEIYTTFQLNDEAGIAYCLHPQQATVKKYDKKDQEKNKVEETGPFIVRSYDRGKEKEASSALTEDGTQEIEYNYTYDDTNLSKKANIAEIQLTEKGRAPIQRGKWSQKYATVKVVTPKAFALTTEIQSTKWKPKDTVTKNGVREYGLKLKKEAKRKPFPSPAEVSTQIMASGSTPLSNTIKKNQEQIDHLQARIDRITQENRNVCNIYNQDRTKHCKRQERKKALTKQTDAQEAEVIELQKEQNALLEQNSKFTASLQRTFIGISANMRTMPNEKRKINKDALEKKKDQVEKDKKLLFKEQKNRSSELYPEVMQARQNLAATVLSMARTLVTENNTCVEEYTETTPYYAQYTVGLVSGPAILTKEQALQQVLAKTSLKEAEKTHLITKLLLVNDDSELPDTVEQETDKVEKQLIEKQTAHTTSENDLGDWTDEFVKNSKSTQELQQEVSRNESVLQVQTRKLDEITRFAASVLPVILKHHEQRGITEDECYETILFPKSTKTEKKKEAIAYFKEAVAKSKEAKTA